MDDDLLKKLMDSESAEKIEKLQLQVRGLMNKNRSLNDRAKRAETRSIDLQGIIDKFSGLQDSVEWSGSLPVRKSGSKRKHHGIAILHWTDWHVAEVVEKSRTDGLNEFNPRICRKRVEKLVDGSCSLIDHDRQHIKIEEIVLILGGDFITGYLHPELEQTNAMGPTEETYFAIELLGQAIESLVERLKPKLIRVVCHRGNHGRTTKRMQFKNDYETSYESMIYWLLRDRFDGPEFQWDIPKSSVEYTALLPDTLIRSAHGHQIKFQGGIGGLLVPANRWVVKQNQTRSAIMTFIGHFHNRNLMSGLTVSGSLKGFDEYAMDKGFKFEEPCQSYQLFDVRRKKMTGAWPIFCG